MRLVQVTCRQVRGEVSGRAVASEQQPVIVRVVLVHEAGGRAVVLAPCPHTRRRMHVVLRLCTTRHNGFAVRTQAAAAELYGVPIEELHDRS